MIISEFGYQRAVSQVEKVSDLCRRASLKTQNPQVLRDLREVRNEAEVIKEILTGDVKAEPVKPAKGSKVSTTLSPTEEAGPQSGTTQNPDGPDAA